MHASASNFDSISNKHDLATRYAAVRGQTETLISTLTPEDMAVQSMPDASPVKWHLAHTTWFFETFVLQTNVPEYEAFDDSYSYLFNSYYDAVGPRHPRAARGLLTRPSVARIIEYREYVDLHVMALLNVVIPDELANFIELGIAHEEQHQELLLMDILHLFSASPLSPAFDAAWPRPSAGRRGKFIPMPAGINSVGHDGAGFAFDHEGPAHQVLLQEFEMSDRLVTNGQWVEFIKDGGYQKPQYWLADGWAKIQEGGWRSPLYWELHDGMWSQMTLRGKEPLNFDEPVTHVSYYEAAAFADWAGARLPTEYEWEVAAGRGVLSSPGA